MVKLGWVLWGGYCCLGGCDVCDVLVGSIYMVVVVCVVVFYCYRLIMW